MTTENSSVDQIDLVDQKVSIFQPLLKEVMLSKGKETEIITIVRDTVSGFKRIYSHLGVLGERELNNALTKFVQSLVPEGESRATLEAGFEKDPDRVKHESHHDVLTSEWNTVLDNIVIGITAVRDQRSESIRTWYLRSTV